MENSGIKKERAETTDGSGDENIDNKTHSRRVFIELLVSKIQVTISLFCVCVFLNMHVNVCTNIVKEKGYGLFENDIVLFYFYYYYFFYWGGSPVILSYKTILLRQV